MFTSLLKLRPQLILPIFDVYICSVFISAADLVKNACFQLVIKSGNAQKGGYLNSKHFAGTTLINGRDFHLLADHTTKLRFHQAQHL